MTLDEQRYGVITAADVARLRGRIGVVYPIEDTFIRYVNADSIRRVARAIGDVNPLFTDPGYAEGTSFGRLVAPPALLYGVAWSAWDMRRGEGLPDIHALHSGDHWLYERPLLAGDEVSATKRLVAVEEREGAYAGRFVKQVREFTFVNQQQARVARCQMLVIRTERDAARQRGKYADVPLARYGDEDLARIEAGYDAEEVRGAAPRWWEDVAVGDTLQPVVKGPLAVADVMGWLIGVGTPYVRTGHYWLNLRRSAPEVAVRNPETGIPEPVERVHWDRFMAAEVGMPAPFDYGSQRAAWATHLLTNWAGDAGFLAELQVEYRGMNFLGDTVWIGGTVTRKWRGVRSGLGYVECAIRAENQRGQDIMPGRAVVALPSPDGGPLELPIDVEADRPPGESEADGDRAG